MTCNCKGALRSTINPSGIMAAFSPFCHFYMPPLTHHQHPLGQVLLGKYQCYFDCSKPYINTHSLAHSRDHHHKSFVQNPGRNLLEGFGLVGFRCEMTEGLSLRQQTVVQGVFMATSQLSRVVCKVWANQNMHRN